MMKVLHLADTHLGYNAYRKVNKQGINQREQDTYEAFQHIIDFAVKEQPDVVIHAGDLFDSVRPTNRAISCALHQILRLSKKKIPFVIVDGNHEHPKLSETGHIFKIFNHLDHVYPVYQHTFEKIQIEKNKEHLCIHAVPQCSSKESFEQVFQSISPDPDATYNILVAHGSVKGIKALSMNEFNELYIPASALQDKYSYVALGHYHTYTKVQKNVVYAGSPERFSFTDADQHKGFVEINLKDKITHTFHPLSLRTMVDATPIHCSGKSVDAITNEIKKTLQNIQPDKKIIRLKLQDIPAATYRGLDIKDIKDLCKHSIHFELKPQLHEEALDSVRESTKIGALINEFDAFLTTQQIEEKTAIKKLGHQYLETIHTTHEES